MKMCCIHSKLFLMMFFMTSRKNKPQHLRVFVIIISVIARLSQREERESELSSLYLSLFITFNESSFLCERKTNFSLLEGYQYFLWYCRYLLVDFRFLYDGNLIQIDASFCSSTVQLQKQIEKSTIDY